MNILRVVRSWILRPFHSSSNPNKNLTSTTTTNAAPSAPALKSEDSIQDFYAPAPPPVSGSINERRRKRQNRYGIGGGGSRIPKFDHLSTPSEKNPELFPFGLPSPPKYFTFSGFGWGYGWGCSMGPFLGIGVGFGFPGGVIFGGGAGLGAVCGTGFSSGLLLGSGQAYIPFGYQKPAFFTPRFLEMERAVELWRIRNFPYKPDITTTTTSEAPRPPVFYTLPALIQRGMRRVANRFGMTIPEDPTLDQRQKEMVENQQPP